jgi:F-type H+-transporting ATPase subunit b
MEEILSKIGFDYRVAFANLINFLIVLWVLAKFAFPKIQKVLSDRQARIHKGLRDAEAAAQAKIDAEKAGDVVRDSAHAEARTIVSDGQSEAQKIIDQAYVAGMDEKEALVASAQKVIDTEKLKAEGELKAKGQDLVEDALKNVFQNDITDKQHQAYANKVATYLND